MKSPAFQFYPKDFLSSPDVQMMDAKEVGAYCLLLFNAWEATDRPGYLPNDERKLQRWARLTKEEWLESREILLEKFPVSTCGQYRYNRRLVGEAEKQEVRRERLAENGRKGGRPSKNQEQTNDKANDNLLVSEDNLKVSKTKADERLAFASAIASTNNTSSLSLSGVGTGEEVRQPANEELPSEGSNASASHTRGAAPEKPPLMFLSFAQTPYATLAGLTKLVSDLKLSDVNLEYYLQTIGQKAGREDNRTPEAWHSYATRFLTNDVKYGKLITNTLPVAPNPQSHAITRTGNSAAPAGGQVGKRRNAVEEARALIQARRDPTFRS